MQGLLLEHMRNDSFNTVDTSLEQDGEQLTLLMHSWGRCQRATEAGSHHLPCEIATFLALKAWNINPAPTVLLFVNKDSLSFPSYRSCGQPDGLISGSLAAFRHKLRGGAGLRSAGPLLPSQASHKEQAAAGRRHWQYSTLKKSTGVCWVLLTEREAKLKL